MGAFSNKGGRSSVVSATHYVVKAGKHTTSGGDATESITATGVVAGDIAILTVQTVNGTPRSIVSAIPTTNAITVVMSGDPSTDHIISWMVLRAA